MEITYLNQLPCDIRKLVEKIEQSSGVEILVKVDSSRLYKGTLACDVDKAQILIPSKDCFPESSVLHELLHIHRFLLDGVPQIIQGDDMNYWTGQSEKSLTHLDNRLEHLIIVPEEIKHRPNRKAYWVNVMRRDLIDNESGNITIDVLLNWIFIQHVLKDDELIMKANTLLSRFKANDKATQLFDAIVPSLHSKEKIVKIIFDYIDQPPKVGSFLYNDGRIVPLPVAFAKLP